MEHNLYDDIFQARFLLTLAFPAFVEDDRSWIIHQCRSIPSVHPDDQCQLPLLRAVTSPSVPDDACLFQLYLFFIIFVSHTVFSWWFMYDLDVHRVICEVFEKRMDLCTEHFCVCYKIVFIFLCHCWDPIETKLCTSVQDNSLFLLTDQTSICWMQQGVLCPLTDYSACVHIFFCAVHEYDTERKNLMVFLLIVSFTADLSEFFNQ